MKGTGGKMLELFKNRRSTHLYKGDSVTQEQLDSIIKAGLLAPSSKAVYPVEFVVVENKSTIERLRDCKSFGTKALDTAPLVIVVIGKQQESDAWVEDCSIATTFMFLQVEKLGLGANWIQIRNRQSEFGDSQEAVRNLLEIPNEYGVLCLLAVGAKKETKPAYTDEWYNFDKMHKEKY